MADEEIVVEIEPAPNAEGKEIEVKPEAPAAEKGAKDAKPASKVEPKPDDAFEALKAQHEALKARQEQERAARVQAEAYAIAARDEVARVTRQVADGEYQIIANGHAAAEAESESAAREYEAAFEVGDKVRTREALVKLADARARLNDMAAGKAALDAKSKSELEARTQPPRRQQPSDPVEAYIADHSQRAQSWFREHRECVTDPEKNSLAIAAHHAAIKGGMAPDSDGYFEFIERRLGYRGEEQSGGKRKTSAPSAPVSRDVDAAAGRLTSERVKLTAREVQAAEDLGLTTAEYARRKVLMTKEGFYRVE